MRSTNQSQTNTQKQVRDAAIQITREQIDGEVYYTTTRRGIVYSACLANDGDWMASWSRLVLGCWQLKGKYYRDVEALARGCKALAGLPAFLADATSQRLELVKFHKHYITDGTTKARVRYSLDNRTDGRKCVTIYAKDNSHGLGYLFAHDYEYVRFNHGTVLLFEDNPLYSAARTHAESHVNSQNQSIKDY